MKHEAFPYLEGRSISLMMQGLPVLTPDGKRKYARLRIATGHTIDPDLWDTDAGKPIPAYSLADQYRLETDVASRVAKLNIARARAQEEGELTPHRIKEIYLDLTGARLAPVVEIKDCKLVDLMRELTTKVDSALTVASYDAFIQKLEAFDPRVKVSQLTDAWRDRFFQWIRDRHGLNDNSMWTQAKHLNRVINEAKRRNMSIRIETSHPFTQTPPEGDYLDWSDISKIVRHKPKTEHLQQLKTLVLTMVLTGCRVSDLWSCIESIKQQDGGYWAASYQTKKKCGNVHPWVGPVILRPLIEQLAQGIPSKRSEQRLRDGIVTLMRAVGIQKHVTCHDLRRSAITNYLALGLPETLIAKLYSGHQLGGELRVMMGYDRADIASKQRTWLRLLGNVPREDVAGLKLL